MCDSAVILKYVDNQLCFTCSDNLGEDLIYLWVEAVREFLQKKADYAGLFVLLNITI